MVLHLVLLSIVYEGGMDFANPEGMVVPPPTNKASSILDAALDAGQQIAKDQNRVTNESFLPRSREEESGFFENLGGPQTMDFVKRILQIMARPEFQDPEGVAAGFAGAAYGLQKDEEKAAQKAIDQQRLELQDRRQAFLDKLRIEEAARAERREQRAEKRAGETTYRILTEKQEARLVSRAKQLKDVADYVNDNSAGYISRQMGSDLPSEDSVYADLVMAATAKMDEQKIPFDKAIRLVVRERQQTPATSSTPPTQQSADPAGNVKTRKPK